MAFTGKTTYAAGAALPEMVEDVSDIIGIVSPYETPLLDLLGNPRAVATSTVHSWMEDVLAPNMTTIDQSTFSPSATAVQSFAVEHTGRVRPGDLVRVEGSSEVMFVSGIAGATIFVTRGYGGTTAEALADNKVVHIIGNAALEGQDAGKVSFTNRVRKSNYTQIFSAPIEVSGSMQAVKVHGVQDELNYQKQERIRELLRDLENTVINGIASETNSIGDASTPRTMNGIINALETNVFEPGADGIPDGAGSGNDILNEGLLNAALKRVWENSSGSVDTIVVGGAQKRRINEFSGASTRYTPESETVGGLVNTYESDFGICKIVLSRWMPSNSVMMLDSSRASVLPLSGRSFHYKSIASIGDSLRGLVVGEYTTELLNEQAHGVLGGLAV